MAEPTSVLTFEDLVIELSRKMGTASYGADGDLAVQVPTDVHDLAEAKRMVNNAIRMFINDAPTSGWRWTRPIGSFVLWTDIAVDSTNTVTFAGYDPASNKTTITVTSAVFLATMEEKTLTLTTTGDQTITDIVSTTSVKVSGQLTSAIDGETFSITADGNYTLPATFGGVPSGAPITYAADSNLGVGLKWDSESNLRAWRSDTEQSGDPFAAAIRPKATVVGVRRRWELMVYPTPSAEVTVEFPFDLVFDKLVEFTEVLPTPITQDENVKAAVLAIGDKEGEGILGTDWQYYTDKALPNAYRIDARSAAKRIGSFNDPGNVSNAEAIRVFRARLFQRPDVTFNS
jgi:hypothetical protein